LKAAKGAPCMRCNRQDPTVCARHANWQEYGKGYGLKAHDCFVAYLCQTCNTAVDTASRTYSADDRKALWVTAYTKTVLYWFEEGLVVVN
jgi:hypothetical protein